MPNMCMSAANSRFYMDIAVPGGANEIPAMRRILFIRSSKDPYISFGKTLLEVLL